MKQLLKEVEDGFKAKRITDVRTGDTVKVYQRIMEGGKERIQVFEGLIISHKRSQSLTATITVRRIASGVGVERTFQLHSPLLQKVVVIKRSRVRQKTLGYMRDRSGKAARLTSLLFDKTMVNYVPEVEDKAALPEEVVAAAEKVEESVDSQEPPVEKTETAVA